MCWGYHRLMGLGRPTVAILPRGRLLNMSLFGFSEINSTCVVHSHESVGYNGDTRVHQGVGAVHPRCGDGQGELQDPLGLGAESGHPKSSRYLYHHVG